VDAEASTLDWEVYHAPLLYAYNTAVSSSTKVTTFKATFGYDPRVQLWRGVEYPGEEIVERKDFAEYVAEVKHTQRRTLQLHTITINRSDRRTRTSMTQTKRWSTQSTWWPTRCG
jgi:hypothetical protein